MKKFKEFKPDVSNLLVKECNNPDEVNDNIPEVLGIIQERHKEMTGKITRLLTENKSIHLTIIELSKDCSHANELFWYSFLIGAFAEHYKSCHSDETGEDLSSMIIKALEALKKNKGK